MNPIRALFVPLQPSVDHGSEDQVVYEEVLPDLYLRDYVHCYWHLFSTHRLDDPFVYRVVSDGCVDVLLERQRPDEPYITGFSKRYITYELGHHFYYLGIRFLPAGFPAIFDVSASYLTNKFLPLVDVCPVLHSSLLLRTSELKDLVQSSVVFDEILKAFIEARGKPLAIDQRLMNAMDQILQSRGQINVTELDVGVSERQLRRLFDHYFGGSAKTFAKVIRFQNILGSGQSLGQRMGNQIFYREGYYDQAHFIKEFKAFYGVTPGEVFRP
ncbi:MAG: helix-turn-helix domain-containing protein [Bacteroidota bacterium]